MSLTSIDPGAHGEIWLGEGVDCSIGTERSGGTARCVFLRNFDTVANQDLSIGADEIANHFSNVSECVDSGNVTLGREISLYFLVLTSASQDVGQENRFAWPADEPNVTAKVDLLGPSPPTGLVALTGDESIIVGFSSNSDTDKQGYYVYAERIDGADVVASSGAGGNGGSGGFGGGGGSGGFGGSGGSGGGTAGGGATDLTTSSTSTSASTTSSSTGGAETNTCGGSVLIPDEFPPDDDVYNKGSTGKTSTEVQAKGLENQIDYAVAVAAYDLVGNVGKLSEVVCGTPLPVDDFFKKYRQAGGEAGGGFCNFNGTGGRFTSGALVALGLALSGLALRRRARSNRFEGRAQ